MNTILEIKNVKKSFDKKEVLKGINLEVKEGEINSVLGPSGCGKSTLLNIIAGILPLDDGMVVLNGQEISGPNKYLPIEKRNINMVFQDFALWPHMNARDNILYGLKIKKIKEEERKESLDRVVSLLHLEGLLNQYPSELSGGQQQRVAIARALITEPALILLDEPLCNLDIQLRVEMRTEMASLFHQLKTTVFHVTHDPSEAFAMADRIIVMNQGVIDQVDTPEQCYKCPKTETVAGLLGAGNILKKGKLVKHDEKAVVQIGAGCIMGMVPGRKDTLSNTNVVMRFRPDDCKWSETAENAIHVKVIMSTFEGEQYRVKVVTDEQEEFCILSPKWLEPEQTGYVKIEENKLYVYEQN